MIELTTSRWQVVQRLLLVGVIVTLPLNLFLKWVSSDALVHGLVSDYLLPKWYLSDFFLAPLLACAAWSGWQWWRKHGYLKPKLGWNWGTVATLIISGWMIRAGLSGSIGQIWYLAQLSAAGSVGYWLSRPQQAQVRNHWLIFGALLLTLLAQTAVVSTQWLTQQPVASYYWLGETDVSNPLSLQTVTTSDGTTKVLPYGTTPHPNVLAGTTVLTWVWLLLLTSKLCSHSRSKAQKAGWLVLFWLGSVATGIILGWAQSVSAYLAMVSVLLLLILHCWPKFREFPWPKPLLITMWVLGWLLAPYWLAALTAWWPTLLSDTSWSRRLWLQDAAFELWRQHWWQGIGLNHFTAQVETVAPSREVVRFFQPVHHVGWLWLTETGVLGLIPLLYWLKKLPIRALLLVIALTPILALDHYLLTQHHGWWLMMLLLAQLILEMGLDKEKAPIGYT